MPLVRVEVRNEYGLGAPELYKDADKEDPKALLEGLAVAGLVGILRQLGDLAEFAAEVFHGIQEQVTVTSSRSHKLMGRVKQIEASLPPLEKLVLAQSSHLHFAYTAGLNWRASLQNEQSHFIYSDLPRFMMDSYEQCRGPPNLNLLDKFDPGGPGSCLKRYSDPSFFKKALKGSRMAHKKIRKSKKKRPWLQIGEVSPRTVSNYSGSTHFPSLNVGEQTSPCPTVSTYDVKDLDLVDQSLSFDSRNGSVDFEHVSHPRYPMPYKERDSTGSCSSQSKMQHNYSHNFTSSDNKDAVTYGDSPSSISGEGMGFKSNQVSWDEKMEMLSVAAAREHDHDEMLENFSTNLSLENDGGEVSHLRDESMEAFSSNLDLETDERVSDHFHTFEVYHYEESLETLSTNDNVEKQGGTVQFERASQTDILPENEKWPMKVPDDDDHDDLHCGTVVEMNTHLDDKNILQSNSGGSQHDEIESETDHFVDALNAIESEYESDVDGQTKQETEQHSRIDIKEHGIEEEWLTTPPRSGIISSCPEVVVHTNGSSNFSTSGIYPDPDLLEFCSEVGISLDKLTSTDKANSVPFESHASFQHQHPDMACNSSRSSDVDSLKNDIIGSLNAESAVRNVSFLGRDMFGPGNDKSTCCSPVLPKPPPEPSTGSTMLWTNGGLLGLEPSKPPDFSLANMGSQVPAKTREDTSTSSIPKSNVKDKSNTSIKQDDISECLTSYQDDRKSESLTRKAQWKSMPTDLGVNLQKLSDSYLQTYSGNIRKDAFTHSGVVQPVRPDIESSVSPQEKSHSSRMLELGNKLILNGFYRKPALLKDENSHPSSFVNVNGFEQSSGHNVGYQTFSARGREMLGSESPLISPASSPPLGHMKISFQPINGSEAPKLQLKLPDGNFNHETGRDLFTSFQLVPDPSIQFRNFSYDSDDETFCRSSPCESDYLSNQSDSNSERWESHGSPSNKEKDLYDALRRISLTETVPTSSENSEAVHGEIKNSYRPLSQFPRDTVDRSFSSHLYDELPSLDSIQTSFKEVRSNYVPEQCYQNKCTTSPPLPQSQLQAMKPQLEYPESRQINTPENPGHIFDGKLGSTVTQKPKPAPISQEDINGNAHMLKSKPQNLRKLTPGKDVDQSSNGNTEQKGDFLHQIRAKSFNLRRTAIPKPPVAADTMNLQVNAILEKANAIRKAVGSDREDDNWSDT